jgi:thioredoxin-dependent peroxiredoxin
VTRFSFVLACLASIVCSLACARADDRPNVGTKPDSFLVLDDTGKGWKSEDHVGKKILVVYFYPADFTEDGARQACGFRDAFKTLTDKNVEVVGVSGDTVQTHEKFKKDHKLPFALLADEKGDAAAKLGVPVRIAKGAVTVKLGGQEVTFERGATCQRWTVIIDKEGKIAYKEAVRDPAGDAKKVLEVVERLGN